MAQNFKKTAVAPCNWSIECTMLSNGLRRLSPHDAALFVCDIQSIFRPLVFNCETVISRSKFMYQTAKVLDIPCFTTEHYPKAFGNTVDDLKIDTPVYEKRLFSMLTDEVKQDFMDVEKRSAIIVGMEAHACVLQTALDLVEMGKNVFVICDAVSSQRSHDRTVALQRLNSIGCSLTTSESAMFEMLKTSTHPQFKECSALLKEANARPNEFSDSFTF